jgi:hypothetical protein
MSRTVVAVMTRSPDAEAHTIKTRLARIVPDDQARARLYEAFLSDTIALVRSIGAELRVCYTPEGGAGGFDRVGVRPEELLPQWGRDLGERERHIFDDLFAAGCDHVHVIGSDFPTLPPDHLHEAIATLERGPARLVLGPADDGGYYLIGFSAPTLAGWPEVPDVFSGVRWSTSHALSDTLGLARAFDVEVHVAPGWFDVDDEEGWAKLVASLTDPDARRRAPATAAWVASLRDR